MLYNFFFIQLFLTWIARICAQSRFPFLKNFLIKGFVDYYKINLTELREPNIKNYPTFNSFFIRQLSCELRPIDAEKNHLVSPADGFIAALGNLDEEKIHAKGHYFDLTALLGGDAALAENFHHGSYITTYLAPQNYHRVHMPMDGTLVEMIYIPGKLFSVNPVTTASIPQIFSKNERVVCFFKTAYGLMAVVLVGAMLVGGINTVWAGQVNQKNHRGQQHSSKAVVALRKGDELGYFTMGSTVICLFPKNTVDWLEKITINDPIKYGEAIGLLR